MKKLLILPLFILSFTAFGQFTKPQLYNGINTNIRHKTASQKRLADMLDSLVVSMGTGGGSTYTSSNGITLTGSDFKFGGTLTENTSIDFINTTLHFGDPNLYLTFLDITPNYIDIYASIDGFNNGGYGEVLATPDYVTTTVRTNSANSRNFTISMNGLEYNSTSLFNYKQLFKIDSVGNVSFPNNTSFTINGNAIGTNDAVVLTDAATIDLTATKHTLATSSATRTFTISYTGDDITIEVTLSNTAATYTFPAGSLCISEGVASGDNTVGLAGVSGDKFIIGIKKIGSVYYVAVKNFGQ